MSSAPRSRGLPRPCETSRRKGAVRMPEKVLWIGIVVGSGLT